MAGQVATDSPETSIRTVDVDAIRGEPELLQDHLDEVFPGRTSDPSWRDYYMLEESGHLLCLACYAGEAMVGYAVMFLRPHQHDVRRTIAVSDLIYVQPDWRPTFGLALVRGAEAVLAEQVDTVQWNAPPGSALYKLLKRRRYKVADVVFTKET